jgi:hypothetical protein
VLFLRFVFLISFCLWDRAQFQNPATDISTNRWQQAMTSVENYVNIGNILATGQLRP